MPTGLDLCRLRYLFRSIFIFGGHYSNYYYHNDHVANEEISIYYYYRPQRSCEGYVFTRVYHSVHEGSTWAGALPGTRYLPIQVHPPDQVHPFGTRYSPLGPGTHQDQVPLRTRYTPRTRYTLLGPGTPPGTRYFPPETATVADGTHPTGICCDMGQNDTIGKIELIPAFVLSENKTNC